MAHKAIINNAKQDAADRYYIQTLNVFYGDMASEAPGNRIRELNGGNDDINYQFGGKYVWLVPEYTTVKDLAATHFEIIIQGNEDPTKDDLAKGAGGDYRYLIIANDLGSAAKSVDCKLLRSDSAVPDVPAGYSCMTIDINKGRKKTYLYLLWKLV